MNKLLLAIALFFSSYVSAVEYLVVIDDAVRVRDAPSLDGRSLVMLNKGHLAIKLDEVEGWTKIYFLGREEVSGRKEGWMSSQFLMPEYKTIAAVYKELELIDKGVSLSCNKMPDTDFIQSCNLYLEYALVERGGARLISVDCSAELIAKTADGQAISVPVRQILEHVVNYNKLFSMSILMKSAQSYQLTEVSLKKHKCRVTHFS